LFEFSIFNACFYTLQAIPELLSKIRENTLTISTWLALPTANANTLGLYRRYLIWIRYQWSCLPTVTDVHAYTTRMITQFKYHHPSKDCSNEVSKTNFPGEDYPIHIPCEREATSCKPISPNHRVLTDSTL